MAFRYYLNHSRRGRRPGGNGRGPYACLHREGGCVRDKVTIPETEWRPCPPAWRVRFHA